MKRTFKNDSELKAFIAEEVFTGPEAQEYLGITKQGFDKQVKLGRIVPIKGRLFWRADLDLYRSSVKVGRPRKTDV